MNQNNLLAGLGSASNANGNGAVVAENLGFAGRKRKAALLAIQNADPGEIPPGIMASITAGQLKIVDKTHRLTKPVKGSIVKMLEPKDTRQIGVQSIDKSALSGDNVFFVTGIRVLLGYATLETGETADDIPLNTINWKPINFGTYEPRALYNAAGKVTVLAEDDDIPSGATVIGVTTQYEEWFPGLQNGELTLRLNNSKNVVNELNLNVFCNETGTFQLDNSRVIAPDQKIELFIDWDTDTNIVSTEDGEALYVVVELDGCELIPRG